MNVGRKSDLGWSSVLISGMRKAREEVAKRRVVDSNMTAVSRNVKSVVYDDLVVISCRKVSSCQEEREEEEEGLTYSLVKRQLAKDSFVSAFVVLCVTRLLWDWDSECAPLRA